MLTSALPYRNRYESVDDKCTNVQEQVRISKLVYCRSGTGTEPVELRSSYYATVHELLQIS